MYSIIPLEMFFVEGLAKLEIGLAKGKKLYDKREAITKKTQERDIYPFSYQELQSLQVLS